MLRDKLSKLDRRVLELARQDDACRLMMTMPGVGAVVALTVRSATRRGSGRRATWGHSSV